jgi:RNA:NAD 2'-phosphotransferase (TPT1/KptA family)
MLIVRVAEALRGGVTFYRGNDKVWLAAHVPPDFITFPLDEREPDGG